MKRFLIIAVAALMGLVSCTKESQLIGSWKLESTTIANEGVEMTISAEEAKVDEVFVFKPDGKVEHIVNGKSDGDAMYTVSGKTLTLIEDQGAILFEYSVKGRTLTLIGDIEGVKVTMNFKKI